MLRDLIGKQQMILFKMRTGDFLFNLGDVFFIWPHKIDSLEVHELFSDVLNLLDEVDIVLVEFGLRVDDGDDA